MPEYLTPGVYVEEVSFRAPSIEGVGTSTTGFAGVTLTGPTGTLPATASSPNPNPSQDTTPELLTSFGDFQNIYGGYDNLALPLNSTGVNNVNYMAMAVKAFFDNGGSQLYVSRVFQPGASANGGFAASGVPSKTNVTVAARFPGASGNQSVGVKLKATRTQNVASLPSGSLVASAANTAQLANAVGTTDQQITLSAPLPWGAPTGAPLTILIDNETMTVSKTDATGTVLSVSRAAAPATHAAGAVVLGQVGYLFSALGGGVTSLTISAVPTAAATPTTDAGARADRDRHHADHHHSGASAKGVPSAQRHPAFLQIDPGGANSEIMTVTQVDATGTVVTVTRGSTTATHTQNAAVFAPIALFTNGSSNSFTSSSQGGSTALPANAAGLYVLTMQVTASTAAESPAVFDGLGFDPAHPYYLGTVLAATPPRHIDALQNQVAFNIGQNLTPTGLFAAIFSNWAGPGASATQTYTLTGGDDGLEPVAADYDTALALFTPIEDIAIVAAPGSGAFDDQQNIIDSLITHVSQQRAYRVAILETPPNQLASDNEGVRAAIDTSYAALYVPWVSTANPLATTGSAASAEITVPPTGFMAGIWARSDEQNGVSKAPANEVILGASRLERDISFAEQGILNPLGINCLRYFPNRGYRVWGARTVSSDPEWKYVNVRRYFIYLEHSIDNSTQWAVFETNGARLWPRAKESIERFLQRVAERQAARRQARRRPTSSAATAPP